MTALLPALFCVGGMALCFTLMSRMHRGGAQSASGAAGPSEDVTALREEVARLRSDLEARDPQHRVSELD